MRRTVIDRRIKFHLRLQHHWREFDATSSRTLVILIVLDALKNHNFVGVVQAELEKGQWQGIVGSGGGVDRLGLQFAKAIGLKVVVSMLCMKVLH